MVDWEKVPDFSKHEFSEDPDLYAHPMLIYGLQEFRDVLGAAVIPSPAPGALARFDADAVKSMHYCNLKAKLPIRSKACDVFVGVDVRTAFVQALASYIFNGIGVYFDKKLNGKIRPMLHLDLRPFGNGHSRQTALIWFCCSGKYVYPQYDPYGMKEFFKLMGS